MAGGGSKPGERRGGRQKGTPNKVTREIKEMVVEALLRGGGVAYLVRQAEKNPAAFMGLLGKVLPLQLTGAGDGPVQFRVINYDVATGVDRAEDWGKKEVHR